MIRRPRLLVLAAAALTALGLVAPAAATSPAPTAVTTTASSTSAYAYLEAHYPNLDSNWHNFSIATRLLHDLKKTDARLTSVLFSSRSKATFLVPEDRAFQILLKQVTGFTYETEAGIVNKIEHLATADVDKLLGYGIISGRTLSARSIVGLDGANLATRWTAWQWGDKGGTRTVHVAVYQFSSGTTVSFWDKDQRFRNPRLLWWATNRNAGNPEIIQGVDRVALGFYEHMARDWFSTTIDGSMLFDLEPIDVQCPPPLPCTSAGSSGHG